MKKIYLIFLGAFIMVLTRYSSTYQSIFFLYVVAFNLYFWVGYFIPKINKKLLLLPLFLIDSFAIVMNPLNIWTVGVFLAEFTLASLGLGLSHFINKIEFDKSRKIIFCGLVLGMNLLFFYGTPHWEYYLYTNTSTSKIEINQAVLKDIHGKEYTFKDFENKIILLDFWSTSCGACIINFPNIEKIQAHYAQNPRVQIALVNIGGRGDTYEEMVEFVQERQLSHLLFLYDIDGSFSKNFGVEAIPECYIMRNDTVFWNHSGISESEKNIFAPKVIQFIKKLEAL